MLWLWFIHVWHEVNKHYFHLGPKHNGEKEPISLNIRTSKSYVIIKARLLPWMSYSIAAASLPLSLDWILTPQEGSQSEIGVLAAGGLCVRVTLGLAKKSLIRQGSVLLKPVELVQFDRLTKFKLD